MDEYEHSSVSSDSSCTRAGIPGGRAQPPLHFPLSSHMTFHPTTIYAKHYSM